MQRYAGDVVGEQTVSVVTAALRGLLDKDFITQDKDGYMVYDPFFALWLQQNIRR